MLCRHDPVHLTQVDERLGRATKFASKTTASFLRGFTACCMHSLRSHTCKLSGVFLTRMSSEKRFHFISRLRTRNSARLSDRLRTTPRGRSVFCCAKAQQKLKCSLPSPLRGNRKGCTKASCVGICADLRCGARA